MFAVIYFFFLAGTLNIFADQGKNRKNRKNCKNPQKFRATR